MGRVGREHKREQGRKRLVYVAQFGGHRSGRGLRLSERQAPAAHGPEVGDQCDPERREATAKTGVLVTRHHPNVPASPVSAVSQPPKPGDESGPEPAARAGLVQKAAAKTFDFPMPLHEVSKILKEKKKVSAWNKVHKVISRMIEENEKYRHRLRSQNLSSENWVVQLLLHSEESEAA